MFPYLDLKGFEARALMAASDVAIVEGIAPGFTAQRIAVRSSYINARLRKRYGNAPTVGNSLPLGQKPPALLGAGTSPPDVVLTGRPVLGCLELALDILVAGAVGTATFQWSQDGGTSWNIGATPTSSGTSPPVVTLSGASALALPSDLIIALASPGARGAARFEYSADGGTTWTISPALASSGTSPPPVTVAGLSVLGLPSDLVIEVTTAGGLGVALVQYSLDGGATWVTGVPTAAAVPVGDSGLTASFPAALYATDNVYTGQGIQTAASVALGATGLVASFPTGTYSADNVYVGQGITTAPIVTLGATGLQANFPAGEYSADNAFAAATPVPETVLGWLAAMVTVDVYKKRGRNPQDPGMVDANADLEAALADLKEAADSQDALFDLPASEDVDSAVTTGGPLAYSESSPYVWTDREARAGRGQDSRGRGEDT